MVPVSIIIPTLNEASHLDACLQNLTPLREAGAEIIVVDGGSADATCTLAEASGVLLERAARGRALQMNAGARRARGRLLLFVHADSKLSVAACKALLSLGPAQRWGRLAVHFDTPGRRYRFLAWMIRQRSRLTGIVTGDQAIFVTQELFEHVGGFPEIPLMEDVAISRVLRRQQWPLCLEARVETSARRWQQRGYLHTILLMWRLRLGYFFGEDVQRLANRYR